ncbi:hypothetical protein TNCV_3152191 [Trichonephila clavipes]|nr:hypothetical protein TNCV_3152191 [Trichonephila clavipes]
MATLHIPPQQFRHGTEGERNILQFPALGISAHNTFRPTDLMCTYSVCTWRVFGDVGHRTQAFRSEVRCSNTRLPMAEYKKNIICKSDDSIALFLFLFNFRNIDPTKEY